MLTTEQHAKLIECADAHRAADEYIAGKYEDGTGKGCAIGCTIMDCQRLGVLDATVSRDDHAALAEATGIPELALLLQDYIFEDLLADERTAWPSRFLRAFKPGADYSRFAARVMARIAARLADDAIRDDVREAAKTIAALLARRAQGDEPTDGEWRTVCKQADAACLQADAARQQSYAAWLQADAACLQAYTAWKQGDVVQQQSYALWQQADAVAQRADATQQQAEAVWQNFWRWLADVVCEELSRE